MLLLLLIACDPCTPFTEMTLPDDAEALAQVIDDFAAWTGRDGVCVPAVEWRDQLSGDDAVLGRYDGPGQPILLRSIEAPTASAAVTLRHELCHALDNEEGLALALASGLNAAAVDPVAYPTPELRLAEAFARACEAGPPRLELRAALTDTCGLDPDPVAAGLRDLAYPNAPAERLVEVGAPPTAALVFPPGDGVLLDAAARNDSLWLLFDDGTTKSVVTYRGDTVTSRTTVPGDVHALGAADAGSLVIGTSGVLRLTDMEPAYNAEAASAAEADGALWVTTPGGLVGPDPDHEPPPDTERIPAIDVDVVADHVAAVIPDAGLWLDGQASPGIDGGDAVALSPNGERILTWYIAGISGVADDAGDAWRIHTSCDASLSGAAPIWWQERPWLAAQTDAPTLFAW